MTRADRRSSFLRIVAVILCVSVLVFFSALLMHHHGIGDHAEHCQICVLGHTTPSTAPVIGLIVTMQMLMVLLACAPSRGSPSIIAVPTTRPPPTSL
jgi:hypothetical protein